MLPKVSTIFVKSLSLFELLFQTLTTDVLD